MQEVEMVNQGQVKADLKKIGCKLKSQLDGNWAIYEPKGHRVVVASLEEAHQYYLSKASAADSAPSNSQKTASERVVHTQVQPVPEKVRQSVIRTQVQPVPDELRQSAALPTQVQPVPDELRQAAVVHTQVQPVPEDLKRATAKAAGRAGGSGHQEVGSEIDKSQIKSDLQKLGYKLKSQMNGSWAIFEPRGNRVMFETFDEVKRYYLSVMSGDSIIQQESYDSAKTVQMPAQKAQVKITRPNRKITRTGHAIRASAELSTAIEKANHVINLLKEKRLKAGINVTRSELRNNLLVKVCSEELLDDVMRYVDTRLDKECLERSLVKRSFKNHLGEVDVMYFDIRYASLLAPVNN